MKKDQFSRKSLLTVLAVFLLIFSGCKKKEDDGVIVTLATISTQTVSAITQNSAATGGYITDDGGAAITARGVCWSTSAQPVISNDKTSDGSGAGSYASNLTGLSPDTRYYIRAYATNSAGTAYGQQEEITTSEPPLDLMTDLMSYWKMDENSGTTVADALGDWNLTFVGSPAWAAGKINSALDFGTVSSRFVEKSGVNSGNKNTYTLSAWIYLEDNLPNPKLIMGINSGVVVSNAGAAEVKMMITSDNQLASLYHTSDGALGVMQRISGTVIALNTWYHVAAVINNGNIELYINGVSDNANAVTNPTGSNLNFTNGRATVGHARLWEGAYNPDRWFRGKIDEAGIWARPLSVEEIQHLYSGGNGLQYPFSVQ
ncbi:MAG: LamG domain-containing protein [Bacteroidota bacterium]